MKTFIAKYLFLIIWIAAIVAIGALFVWVFQLNSHLSPLATNPPPNSGVNTPPPPPPAPSISLTLQKEKGKNTLTINWANLPGNTVALKIYRGKKGTSTSTWQLWKTINIPFGQLSGNAQFDPGTGTYSYYVEAVSGNDNGTSTGGGNGDIVWQSGVTDPGSETPTSTPPQNPPAPTSTDNDPGNSSGTPQNPPPPPPPPAPTSTGNPGNTPTGTPYYNPQIQISGYGSDQNGNFWVQHVDQKIQMGWQNLPQDTTSIVIYRSPNQDGPWTMVLTQNNPGVNGSYSIQVVDDTLGSPYYYEMNAVAGSSTIATYGPIYLAGQ